MPFVVISLRGYFNPRFPRGKRPRPVLDEVMTISISIHASRGGSDGRIVKAGDGDVDFNPRFPRGKRPCKVIFYLLYLLYFNPRFPRGKRLISGGVVGGAVGISIHASRGGSDQNLRASVIPKKISIHASRGGSDHSDPERYSAAYGISIHASRGGSDETIST